MRGEHHNLHENHLLTNGSSPHAWGTCSHASGFDVLMRFIPTCVGNMRGFSSAVCPSSVHPHMRGEHVLLRNFADALGGSSPHAWGTWFQVRTASQSGRFIPTCVGNISGSNAPPHRWAVHPHMRGEHSVRSSRNLRLVGSSPHAWGTCGRALPRPRAWRFIPTCVGNMPAVIDLIFCIPVHPHMRGEHCSSPAV